MRQHNKTTRFEWENGKKKNSPQQSFNLQPGCQRWGFSIWSSVTFCRYLTHASSEGSLESRVPTRSHLKLKPFCIYKLLLIYWISIFEVLYLPYLPYLIYLPYLPHLPHLPHLLYLFYLLYLPHLLYLHYLIYLPYLLRLLYLHYLIYLPYLLHLLYLFYLFYLPHLLYLPYLPHLPHLLYLFYLFHLPHLLYLPYLPIYLSTLSTLSTYLLSSVQIRINLIGTVQMVSSMTLLLVSQPGSSTAKEAWTATWVHLHATFDHNHAIFLSIHCTIAPCPSISNCIQLHWSRLELLDLLLRQLQLLRCLKAHRSTS